MNMAWFQPNRWDTSFILPWAAQERDWDSYGNTDTYRELTDPLSLDKEQKRNCIESVQKDLNLSELTTNQLKPLPDQKHFRRYTRNIILPSTALGYALSLH